MQRIHVVRRLLLLVLAVAVFLPISWPGGHAADAAGPAPLASYTSPEKIKFISYSKSWDAAKLKALYTELMKNMHGEELAYLGEVVLMAKGVEGEAGYCDMTFTYADDETTVESLDKGTKIVLYDANINKTVASMSDTLSHEYGHMFTYYWLIKKEHKLPSDAKTKWASIRGIKGTKVLFGEQEDNPAYTHYWDPAEIMADDYMALFGSPTAKQTMAQSLKQDGLGFYAEIENERITSVMTLPAVRTYWLTLSGIKDPLPLSFKEPKLTQIKAVVDEEGYISHKLVFDPASTNAAVAKRLQYMVVWYEPIPIDGTAEIDFTSLVTGKTVIAVPDGLPESKLVFVVYAYDPITKQYVYAKQTNYDLTKPAKPVKLAS